ncbi:MAG: hypothetical protein ABIH42_08455 [Planctomycetota bacterium]
MSGLKIWDWKQPSGKVWKVETNKEAGIVKTVNQDGVTVLEQTGMSPAAVELIETQFMSVVGTEAVPVRVEHNPMYV